MSVKDQHGVAVAPSLPHHLLLAPSLGTSLPPSNLPNKPPAQILSTCCPLSPEHTFPITFWPYFPLPIHDCRWPQREALGSQSVPLGPAGRSTGPLRPRTQIYSGDCAQPEVLTLSGAEGTGHKPFPRDFVSLCFLSEFLPPPRSSETCLDLGLESRQDSSVLSFR